MRLRISTVLPCTADLLWEHLRHPASLRFVAAPLLRFEPLVAGSLDDDWVTGRTYRLRLTLLGLIPAGEHRI